LKEAYVSNEEYATYYLKLNDLRARIARDLPISSGMRVLDVATGGGYFAMEVAELDRSLTITGIDIAPRDVKNARTNVNERGFQDRIEIVEMDATDMKFPDGAFDLAINFMGLEDIHMTRGRAGVERTFHEVRRVLRPGGAFCFVVMPPEEMETMAQRLEVALFSHICDATWLSATGYEGMLKAAGFRLLKKMSYRTGKKLTPEQAREEITFACENVPKIYGVDTPSFQEVWARFGRDIDEKGLGHYSKVVLMLAQKLN
jgi:ubiquinone/menaquinone biosynthesis C-methylase UbiE